MTSQIVRSNGPGIMKKVGWGIMFLLSVSVFLLASRYLALDPEHYFPEQKAVYMVHTTALILHIIGAMLAIIVGPFQFLPRIRTGRLLNLHRWLGRTYLLAVLFGGLGGLYMARLAYGGVISQLGFTFLAILWLFSGSMAYWHIRNKRIELHRQWMTRNYALTFAGVMLRLWVPVFQTAGLDFTLAYVTIAWFCWIPNLIVAEWIIRRIRHSQRRSQRVDLSDTAISGRKTAQIDF